MARGKLRINKEPEKVYFTIQDIAKLKCCSVNQVREWFHYKQIKHKKYKRIRIKKEDLIYFTHGNS